MIGVEEINEALALLDSGRTQAVRNHLEGLLRTERVLEKGAQRGYEQLREAIDAGHESMTHSDALAWINRMSRTFDDLAFINELNEVLDDCKAGLTDAEGRVPADNQELFVRINTVLEIINAEEADDVET